MLEMMTKKNGEQKKTPPPPPPPVIHIHRTSVADGMYISVRSAGQLDG